jgi:hypothetical protein
LRNADAAFRQPLTSRIMPQAIKVAQKALPLL